MQGTLVPPFRSSAVCTVFLPRDSRKVSAKPNSKPIRILAENLHDYDDLRLTSIWENFTQAEIFNTYHGFKGKRKGDPIDYIFFSEEFELEDAYIDQTSFDGRYPSDHYPLVATLRLKK